MPRFDTNHDKQEIDALARAFFGAFSNKAGPPNLDGVRDLFVEGGIVVKSAAGAALEIWSLDEFIEPRKTLLASGSLTDFFEEELSERTDVFGGIAQRLSTYRKSGKRGGVAFEGRGTKTFQLARTLAGWRIIAVAWEDEPSV